MSCLVDFYYFYGVIFQNCAGVSNVVALRALLCQHILYKLLKQERFC